jgi:hypothetical protein
MSDGAWLEETEDMALGGDWQAVSYLARNHPDIDERDTWASIWMGLLSVWDAEWEVIDLRRRSAARPGRG